MQGAGDVRVGPSRKVVELSEGLERLLAEDQMRQKTPPGKEKCPVCGAIVEPTRTRKVRTHDDPVKGRRCEGSGMPKPGPASKQAASSAKPRKKGAKA